jgi:hypothetical protein
VNAGKFESVRAGYADYSLPGETAEQLGVRVNAVIEADLRAKLALLVKLHREFGLPGTEFLRPTSSAPAQAGAPKGASAVATPSTPPSVVAPAPSSTGPTSSGSAVSLEARPLKDLVKEVRLDLSDVDPLRLSRKMKVWCDWLGKRGYTSANDVRPGDEWGLGRVLDEFEGINRRG